MVAPNEESTAQVPLVEPFRSATVQASPAALPVQASMMGWGSGRAGGLGTQATVLPSRVARQVPLCVTPESPMASVHASPAALPEQASTWAWPGVQERVPDDETSAESAVVVVRLAVPGLQAAAK